jgi:hypothetical protein
LELKMPHNDPDELDDPDAARSSARSLERAAFHGAVICNGGSPATPHKWVAKTAAVDPDRRGNAHSTAVIRERHPICVDLDAHTADEFVSSETLASRLHGPPVSQSRRTNPWLLRCTFTVTSAATGAVLRG